MTRFRRRALPLTLLASLLLVLAGCEWTDPFAEYRGVNLLAERGIDMNSFSEAYTGGIAPAADYITFDNTLTALEYGTDIGLPGGASDIHRLELVNLLPNGDFEDAIGAPAGWTVNGGASFTVIAGGIQGNSADFDVSVNQSATFDLSNLEDANGALGAFEVPGLYHIAFQFRRSSPENEMAFDYGDGVSISYLSLANIQWVFPARTDTLTPVETVPSIGDESLEAVTIFGTSSTGNDFFYVGTPRVVDVQASIGLVDNIRIGRADTIPHVSLELPVSSDGALDLVPGTYTFGAYVKAEEATQVTPSLTGRNRFRSPQIVLGADNDLVRSAQDTAGWATTAWTPVSRKVRVTADDIAAAETLGDPAVTLRISVSHPDYPEVGSILVAAPFLELTGSQTE